MSKNNSANAAPVHLHDYQPTNRQKRQTPKRGRFWCDRCDKTLVGQIGKCPVCGHVQRPDKIKGA